ncbi:LmeA family phospholipid-binding protein [Streptomyces sp. NPDC003393]
MRALRVLLIVVVILGVLFAVVDRVAVHFAQSEAANKLRSTEHLASTPDVSINGFPFLTQLASGELDDVEVGIKDYDAATGNGTQKIRIARLEADMKGVRFSGDYSSATADSATGTATIGYDELLKTAKSEPTDVGLGIKAQVVGLSYGGNGKVRVAVKFSLLPKPISVLGSVSVRNDKLQVHADALPRLAGVQLIESRFRSITDFQQAIDQLPGDISLDSVQAAKDGVEITVKGTNVKLAG